MPTCIGSVSACIVDVSDGHRVCPDGPRADQSSRTASGYLGRRMAGILAADNPSTVFRSVNQVQILWENDSYYSIESGGHSLFRLLICGVLVRFRAGSLHRSSVTPH